MSENSSFPEVQGGGSLILAWQVRSKHVVVIGGGDVAASRILNVLNANARVTVIAPPDGMHPEVRHRIEQKQVTWIPRYFEREDLLLQDQGGLNAKEEGKNSNETSDRPDSAVVTETPSPRRPSQPIDMVLAAIDDPEASTQIWQVCKSQRIPVNVADVPNECDFYFGSVHRQGPLQIMVSTNGNGPKLAALVRRRIASMLPPNTGEAVAKVGMLRRKLRRMVPGTSEGDIKNRMSWMSRVCEQWTLEELCEMGDKEVEGLLKGFKEGKVPSLKEVRGDEEEWHVGFDGAFGWW